MFHQLESAGEIMELEEECLYFILLRRVIRPRRKVRRNFWVHPILSTRLLKGQFHQLHQELQEDPQKIFAYYRMSEKSLNELHDLVKDDIIRKATNMRLPILPIERLSITIR